MFKIVNFFIIFEKYQISVWFYPIRNTHFKYIKL